MMTLNEQCSRLDDRHLINNSSLISLHTFSPHAITYLHTYPTSLSCKDNDWNCYHVGNCRLGGESWVNGRGWGFSHFLHAGLFAHVIGGVKVFIVENRRWRLRPLGWFQAFSSGLMIGVQNWWLSAALPLQLSNMTRIRPATVRTVTKHSS
jgi:hypothetical protein